MAVPQIRGKVTSVTPAPTNTGVPPKPVNTSGSIRGTVTSVTPAPKPATQNTGVPAMPAGYGGVNYGDQNYGQQRQLDNQRARELNDPAYRQAEIARTQAVIEQRRAQGLDVTAQEKYLTQNLGFNPNAPVANQQPNRPVPGGNYNPVPSLPTSVTGFTPNVPMTPGAGAGQGVTPTIPTPTPAIPVRDQQKIAEYVQRQIQASLDAARSAADRTKAEGQLTASRQTDALRTAYERLRQDVSEDRSFEDAAFDRLNDPFAGSTQYRAALRDYSRERSDRESQQDYETRQAQIQQDLSILERDIEEKYRLIETAAPAERERLAREIENEERAYELMLRGELRSDTMANLGIDESMFNRQLATYNANRSAFESDRAFDYQRERDQVADDQQAWENRFRYGNAIGQFNNGQQTLDMQRFQSDAAYRQQAFNRAILESDRDFNNQQSQQMFQNQFAIEQFNRPYEQLTAAQREQANQFSRNFAENARQYGMDYAMRQAQLDNQIDQQTWNQYMDERRFEMDMQGLELKYLQAQGQEVPVSEYVKIINDSPFIGQATTDSFGSGGQTSTKSNTVTDQAGLADYILSLGLDDAMTDRLLLHYGLPIDPAELNRLGETD